MDRYEQWEGGGVMSAKMPHARVNSVRHRRGDGARPTDIGSWRTRMGHPVRFERAICAAVWREGRKGEEKREEVAAGLGGPGGCAEFGFQRTRAGGKGRARRDDGVCLSAS